MVLCACKRRVSYIERGRNFDSPFCGLWWPSYNFHYITRNRDWTTTRVEACQRDLFLSSNRNGTGERVAWTMKPQAEGKTQASFWDSLHCVIKVHYGTGLQEQNRNHSEILQYGCCHALREGLKTVLVTSSHMMSKTQEARRQYANEFLS